MRIYEKVNGLGLAGFLLFSGCAEYKRPSNSYSSYTKETDKSINLELREQALNHRVYDFVPRHRSQIKFYDLGHWTTWAFFGNDEDGIFGESASPAYSTNISYMTAVRWSVLRNPLHNYNSYIIGTDYLEKHHNFAVFAFDNKRGLRIMAKEKDPTVFGTGPATFQLLLNDAKPYVSFKVPMFFGRKFDFGVGWKERGNFGFKFRPFARRNYEDK
ncbi:MAG: hypothetical protein AABX11_03470 [Nanoarchaeota archaeon]